MNESALSILRILADGKAYTLDQLACLIKVNPVNISRIIQTELTDFKIDIIDSNYCWKDPIVWLNKDSIYSQIQMNHGKLEIILLDVIDSTNSFLKNLLKKKY